MRIIDLCVTKGVKEKPVEVGDEGVNRSQPSDPLGKVNPRILGSRPKILHVPGT